MLAIEVEFLMGRAILSSRENRSEIEWPPHPQRLFSALVAAHGELEPGEDSARALKWLESLRPPEIMADEAPALRMSPSYLQRAGVLILSRAAQGWVVG